MDCQRRMDRRAELSLPREDVPCEWVGKALEHVQGLRSDKYINPNPRVMQGKAVWADTNRMGGYDKG
jgi:hypothetical protein